MTRAVLVVLVHAAVQAVLVLGDPVPGVDAGFVLRAAASAAAALAALVLLAPAPWRRALAPALALMILAGAAAMISPVLTLLVVCVGGLLLPAVGVQAPQQPRSGGARHLLRVAIRGFAVLLLVVLCRVLALVAGLLLDPVGAAAVTWLVVGAVAALVLGGRPGEDEAPMSTGQASSTRTAGGAKTSRAMLSRSPKETPEP